MSNESLATYYAGWDRYQDLLASARPRISRPGITIDVVSGTIDGVTGPALNHVPVQGAVVTLDPATTLDYPLPAAHRVFVHVLSGRAAVAGRDLVEGETAWSDPLPGGSSTLHLASPDGDQPTRLMIYSGTPLREPVVFGGPFVMNRRTEIAQAFQDFHAGRFGEVPRLARLAYDR